MEKNKTYFDIDKIVKIGDFIFDLTKLYKDKRRMFSGFEPGIHYIMYSTLLKSIIDKARKYPDLYSDCDINNDISAVDFDCKKTKDGSVFYPNYATTVSLHFKSCIISGIFLTQARINNMKKVTPKYLLNVYELETDLFEYEERKN